MATSSTATDWTITITGTFDEDCAGCEIYIGEGTPCAPTATSASSVTCTSGPPLSGTQTISIVSEWVPELELEPTTA